MDSRKGQIFFFATDFRRSLEHYQPSIQFRLMGETPGAKGSEREAGHSDPQCLD
jgi:hypothetical protein